MIHGKQVHLQLCPTTHSLNQHPHPLSTKSDQVCPASFYSLTKSVQVCSPGPSPRGEHLRLNFFCHLSCLTSFSRMRKRGFNMFANAPKLLTSERVRASACPAVVPAAALHFGRFGHQAILIEKLVVVRLVRQGKVNLREGGLLLLDDIFIFQSLRQLAVRFALEKFHHPIANAHRKCLKGRDNNSKAL